MSNARPQQLKPRSLPSIDGGVADNENKLIIPQNTTANLAQITPQKGSIAYDTTLNEVVFNNGSSFAPVSSGSTGTVTNVATGTGLTGGPITTTGTVALANTAVTPAAYTNANITVDQQGRITAAANGSSGHSSAGVSGSVQFSDGAGGFNADGSNLFYNGAGVSRLGIGTNSPQFNLDVRDSGGHAGLAITDLNSGTTFDVTVQNTNPIASFEILDVNTGHAALRIESGAADNAIFIQSTSNTFIQMNQPIDMTHHTIQNLADPSGPFQAANKEYVDNRAQAFTSSASTNTTASQTLTVTGLLATDTILAVSQNTAGSSALPLLGWTTVANNAITVQWSANPGAGAVVVVSILR